MEKDKEPTAPDDEQVPIEEPPPFNPDPDLITQLERGGRPEVTRIPESSPHK